LTSANDTNVTLTLSGTPTTALLQATTITAGWTGTLANARLATMAAGTIKGNNTAGTATPIDMTGTQTTALLDIFTTGLKGIVSASGGGTGNFLRADGAWAAPAGGGLAFLGTVSVTSAAALNITSLITSTYDEYLFIGNGFTFAGTPLADFQMQVSQNNGSTWDTAANYSYSANVSNVQASGPNQAALGIFATTSILLTAQQTSGSLPLPAVPATLNFELYAHRPLSTTLYKAFDFQCSFWAGYTPTIFNRVSAVGAYNQAAAINAIRFNLTNGANFTGTVSVFGFSK